MNIIEMAKEAGFDIDPLSHKECVVVYNFQDSESDITEGLEKFAALVRAEREWVDMTDDEMWDVFINKDWTGEPLQLVSAVIAAFKEKNK